MEIVELLSFRGGSYPSPPIFLTTSPCESRKACFNRRLEATQSVCLGLWFKVLIYKELVAFNVS